MTDRELLQQALEALSISTVSPKGEQTRQAARESIRALKTKEKE